VAETILIVTEDEVLLDDLLRLCAAAGAEAEVAHGAPERGADGPAWGAAARWEQAPLVLVGDDCARAGTLGADLTGTPAARRRAGVLLVGRDLDDPGVWERGARLGAEGVVVLPDAETWLAGRIADAAEGRGRAALTVGVLGGRGGSGASTLACALAVTAARAGRRTMLVDGDPLGGGLDIALGAERAEGLRWPAFADSRGRVGGAALEESLPAVHGVSILSWDRAEQATVPADAMQCLLGAARRRADAVVVDLPRQLDAAGAEALVQLDLGLLLVPAELRAVAAAQRLAARLRLGVRDLRAVIRPPNGRGAASAGLPGMDGAQLAGLVGLPLAGELPWETGLPDAAEPGGPPGARDTGPLARFCREFWTRTLPPPAGAAATRAADTRDDEAAA
jgi:secretion/DNA translocation related CpaE-like protein